MWQIRLFLAMIKDLKFEYDLDDVRVDTRFHSELRKITDPYDTRTSSEEVEVVKMLIETSLTGNNTLTLWLRSVTSKCQLRR